MILIAVAILIIANVAMAKHHSNLIRDGKPIKHGIWGGAYLLFAVLLSYLTNSWLLLIDSLFIRKIVFDTALNLFRGKPFFYVSATTTSIIDKFHNKVFKGKSEIYIPIYSLIAIIITILL